MYLKYFYDSSLAQASYMVACQSTGEAAIIDPARNIDAYIHLANEQGFHISAAVETHIHADFVSGVTELSRRTGATIFYSTEGPNNGGYDWDDCLTVQGLRDQDIITIGNVQLKAIHTPGHTPEHMAYELTDKATANLPMGIFTGDFVFVGNVGRPDLLEKALGVKDSADKGARQLFKSLQRFKQYADYIQIWPGHGAGSACGKGLGSIPTSTVGYERMYNPAFQFTEEQPFVDFLLHGQPEPPAYFAKMKAINKRGMTPLANVPAGVEFQLQGDCIAELAKDKKNIVIDTRNAIDYANASLPGTINLPYPGLFADWIGKLVDYESNIYFIAEPYRFDELREIVISIGMDKLRGFFSTSLIQTASSLRSYQNQSPTEIERRFQKNEVQILDVRYQDEWEEARIPEAIHASLPHVKERVKELSTSKPIAVHCASGKRSAIAASILLNEGFEVINIRGGMLQWKNEDLGWTK
ncbi:MULTISPECIES: rhodanese-like domain-containing protein [Virgibacillus]|uniref:MBL fold metallo-hydrolase n=2 Tax=Virgibacillus salarius TaxID=447199 RepID=A0A941DTV0_9BACI|nr:MULTISPECIES: MBL fold metallo-hydrolase [Bacillaceae]MBR7797094.1 MBL fold metallo-hydrolase [Virgibacillus salarius]NAZ09803.1 MBL fold metallo-hydrolase [Agaribacter marinus]